MGDLVIQLEVTVVVVESSPNRPSSLIVAHAFFVLDMG